VSVPLPTAPKFVFVNRYYYPDHSATSQLLTDLTRALVRAGFEVHVICSRQCYGDAKAQMPHEELVEGVAVYRIWTTRFGRGRLLGRALDYATFYCSSWITMLSLLQKGDTVIAKTDPPLISIMAMSAARLKGAHLVNWLQDIFPEVASALRVNPLPWPFTALMRRWRDSSLRFAQINVVLGQRMNDRLQSLGIAAHRIRVIQNWAEEDLEEPKPAALSKLRAELGLNSKFVVGYSGNLGRAHDFLTVLDAAESLRGDTEIVFLMIGGGAGMDQLAQVVGERGLENFRFLPYRPRESLRDALGACDVHWVSLRPALEGLIVPSKFYGILAAQRPVIFIGDLDGEISREIRACDCGSAIGIGDARELTRLLIDWKSDPARCSHMGNCGYRRYQQRFCAPRAFAQWEEILRQPNRAVGALSPAPSRQ
jgi:glycosyltransferase involved in cell wall biosynthesis